MGVLRRLRRQRIRVVVCRASGLCSWIDGWLELFDCHLNLVLREAREECIGVPRGNGTSSSRLAAQGYNQATARWRCRSLAQVLLNGEDVVSLGTSPSDAGSIRG